MPELDFPHDAALAARFDAALGRSVEAAQSGDAPGALRWADKAGRLAAAQPLVLTIIGHSCARLGDLRRALRAFSRAYRLSPTPELHVEIAAALKALGQGRRLALWINEGLSRFATAFESPLVALARESLIADGSAYEGWIGVSSDFTVIGEMVLDSAGDLPLGPALAGAPLSALRRTSVLLGGRRACRFEMGGPLDPSDALSDLIGGRLMGGAARFPPDLRISGRASNRDGRLDGWVACAWRPDAAPRLVARAGAATAEIAPATRDPADPGRWLFDADLTAWDGADRIELSVMTPLGRPLPFPGSPAIARLPAPPEGRGVGPPKHAPDPAAVPLSVIIPVYRGREETLACLASVLSDAAEIASVIVVDDASPDKGLSAALDALFDEGRITLLRNPVNLGFPGSVNRGLLEAAGSDVIVLNADTQVFADWIPRLRAAAYRDAGVGTVTPLTNSGTIASYPSGEPRLGADRCAEIAAVAAHCNDGISVEAPTGVGFCLYIRRDCLEDVGPLDASLFARGYGEENDFCLRASALGWRHVIAADVYVQHRSGTSFGSDRQGLLDRNHRLLVRRHPDYEARIAAFAAENPLRLIRRRLDLARLQSEPGPFVLLVTHALGGGVKRCVDQSAEVRRRAGQRPVILRPLLDQSTMEIHVPDAAVNDLLFRRDEADDLLAALKALGPDEIEIHHVYGLPDAVVDGLFELGAPVDSVVHDYASICPRMSLLGDNERYCGEPPVAVCEVCVVKNGAPLAVTSVADYRGTARRRLERSRRVLTPSRDARTRLYRHLPSVRIEVRPWEEEPLPPTRPVRALSGRARVVLIGALSDWKGFRVLQACAQDAHRRDLPLDFVVVGYTRDDEALETLSNVFITGPYKDWEVEDLLRQERPDVALFPALAPETWCFALTHALRAGLPVAAFDIGAVPERLRALGGRSQLLPLGAPADQVNDALLQLAGAALTPRPEPAVEPIVLLAEPEPSGIRPKSPGSTPSAAGDEGLGRARGETPVGSDATRTTVLNPRATVQLIVLPKGLYRMSLANETTVKDRAIGIPLPAIHIAGGPGSAPGGLEILSDTASESAWLFEPADTLVVQVKAAEAPIVITSYSRDGLEPLHLEVERVGGPKGRRAPKAEAPPRPAPERRLVAPKGKASPSPSAPPPGEGRPAVVAASLRRAANGGAIVPLRVTAHISGAGDVVFMDAPIIGFPDRAQRIEGFQIDPLARLQPDDLEFKSLSETGVESPWTPGGAFTGTRSAGLALSGFALRLKPARANDFDVRCTGYFLSGAKVGPSPAGAPIASGGLNDHLIGMEIELVERMSTPKAEAKVPAESAASAAAPAAAPAQSGLAAHRRVIGPRFSPFRDDED